MNFLSTGEMIDQLKIGDIAESTDSQGMVSKVTKTQEGVIWTESRNPL